MAWIRTTLSLTCLVLVLLGPSLAQQPTAQATSAPGADATRKLLTKSGTLRLLSKTEADIDGVDATNKPAKLIFHLDTSTKCDQVKVGDLVSIIYRIDGSDFTAVRIALMVATTSGKTGDVGGNAKSDSPAHAPAKPQSTTASASNSPKGLGTWAGLTHGYGGISANKGGSTSTAGTAKSGTTAAVHSNDGSIADLHDPRLGMDIHHNIGGTVRVSIERPDHSRTISEGRNRGYIQRPYAFRGHEYARRTYFNDGKSYDLFYIRYLYRGFVLDVYTPSRFYSPAFYGWAYNPWVVPVVYSWGWANEPWFGQFGAIFTPFPVYPTAAFWLTDYLVSDSLKSYYAGTDANAKAATSEQPIFTTDVKLALADEIKRYVAFEQLEASANSEGVAPDPSAASIVSTLNDHLPHVLIAGSDVDLVDSSGTRCAISPGDTIQLTPSPLDNPETAAAVVLVSKRNECQKFEQVHLSLNDLQDMQNSMRAAIDRGLDQLHGQQGTLGLPGAPAAAQAAAVPAAFISGAPLPEQNIATQISVQQQVAEAYEKSYAGQPTSQGSAASPSTSTSSSSAAMAPPPPSEKAPASLSLHQTINDVVSAMGKPERIVNIGNKTIYYYKDIKITFTDGKVTDVQ